MADTLATQFASAPTAPAIKSIPINYGSGNQTFESFGQVRALLISTAGTLKVTWASGLVDTLVLGVGLYPFEIIQIWQTGSSTAAGNVIG